MPRVRDVLKVPQEYSLPMDEEVRTMMRIMAIPTDILRPLEILSGTVKKAAGLALDKILRVLF